MSWQFQLKFQIYVLEGMILQMKQGSEIENLDHAPIKVY